MTQLVSEPVQRVWIDVTMLAGCATQPTGISRVLLAILGEWRKGAFADLRLCRFDDGAQGFVEVAPSLLDRFAAPPHSSRSHALRRNAARVRHGIKQIVKPLVSWLPVAVKRLLKRKLRGYAHFAKEVLKVPAQGMKRLLKRPAIAPILPLGPTDLIVSLGEDWKQPSHAATIYRLKRDRGFRTAYLIHDLIPILFPQFFGPGFAERFTPWLVDTLWSADLLFANSENTKADILQFGLRAGIPTRPVEVVRYGENLPAIGDARQPPDLRDLRAESSLFALCVGTVEVRKNQLLLYHVWRRLIEKLGGDSVPRLIIVGMRGWMGGNTMHLAENDPVTQEHIRFLPTCDDAELRWLYQHCAFTLYPSFYEGWGLPVAESLAFGKHCIAGNRSSIPEIGGDLVAMHEPSSVDECLARVTEALDPAFRAERERRIRQKYRQYEWSECAAQMAEMLRRHFHVVVSRDAERLVG